MDLQSVTGNMSVSSKMGERKKRNLKKEFIGFRRYLFKIVLSNIFLVLLPISILGILWFCMISSQTEKEFLHQKTIELNEIVSGIVQRIKNINLEVALETRDSRYSTYTMSDEYTTDLLMISKRLATMAEKYYFLHSVYFYDNTTGRIYNSNAGSYDFDTFYDKSWLKETKDIYRVQEIPLRNSIDDEALYNRADFFFNQYYDLVLTLVIKGKPDFYLVANISIKKLFKDIMNTYKLNEERMEFFFIANGQVIEGKCEHVTPDVLLNSGFINDDQEVSSIKLNNRIYFAKPIGYGDIICLTSYPEEDVFMESQHLERYIIIVCIGLLIFLLFISVYIARTLYQPINRLYSHIADNTKILQKDNVRDEIDMLKSVFSEMNTFNSSAKLKLKQFDEISRTFGFRNFLEHNQSQKDFIKDHPYLFDQDGNGLCEMLVVKIDYNSIGMQKEEEMIFRLNLQEILRSYLQSSLKGILTKNSDDNLVLLYRINEEQPAEQIRRVITDTVAKLTKQNVYFSISQAIRRVEEILPQYDICSELVETAYFLGWKYEVISEERIKKTESNSEIYNTIINIKTSIIKTIVSQDEAEIDKLFEHLENELRLLANVPQIKEICSLILIDLDHEFHFRKHMEDNLMKSLNDNKTLSDLLFFMKNIFKRIAGQYGKNDAKENYYCEMAKEFLNNNYMRDMNITDVADHLNISYSYLSKIFRAKTGITLTDYLNNVRIEKSKEYLANTFLNISEISKKVGYNNAQSYQRFFKKYFNLTPGDYRRLHNVHQNET